MAQNADCFSVGYSFEIETIPFSEIPFQSRIFIEYQKNPLNLKQFYPLTVSSHTEVLKNARLILEKYQTDRTVLCGALEKINRKCGAEEKTLSNIELLRQSDCVAVVTGQQAGLFTGPLYSIYKALTAIKLAECLQMRGVKAVPVFWIATEDHDFAEVSNAFVINRKGGLSEIKNEPEGCYRGIPVGLVKLDNSINQSIDELFRALPQTAFSSDLREIIESSWQEGMTYGEAFARTMMQLFGRYGLVLLCPLDETLKKLAAPIYLQAIEKSNEILQALLARNQELTEHGFHTQVAIPENYFPIFWQSDDGKRHALKKIDNNTYETKDSLRQFSKEELIRLVKENPSNFSPSVVLRPVVQDYLLPTICYFGGSAEIAYFAQVERIYSVLERPVTPIFHRQSFTFVTPKQIRIMQKYGLGIRELFSGSENVLPLVIEKQISPSISRLFAEVEEEINLQLNRLDREFATIDPTLAENLAKRRRKILYHIASLKQKFNRVQAQKHEVIVRRLENLFASLMPFKHLQERTLNITSFLNLYGQNFIDIVYAAIDLESKDHRVVYMK